MKNIAKVLSTALLAVLISFSSVANTSVKSVTGEVSYKFKEGSGKDEGSISLKIKDSGGMYAEIKSISTLSNPTFYAGYEFKIKDSDITPYNIEISKNKDSSMTLSVDFVVLGEVWIDTDLIGLGEGTIFGFKIKRKLTNNLDVDISVLDEELNEVSASYETGKIKLKITQELTGEKNPSMAVIVPF